MFLNICRSFFLTIFFKIYIVIGLFICCMLIFVVFWIFYVVFIVCWCALCVVFIDCFVCFLFYDLLICWLRLCFVLPCVLFCMLLLCCCWLFLLFVCCCVWCVWLLLLFLMLLYCFGLLFLFAWKMKMLSSIDITYLMEMQTSLSTYASAAKTVAWHHTSAEMLIGVSRDWR